MQSTNILSSLLSREFTRMIKNWWNLAQAHFYHAISLLILKVLTFARGFESALESVNPKDKTVTSWLIAQIPFGNRHLFHPLGQPGVERGDLMWFDNNCIVGGASGSCMGYRDRRCKEMENWVYKPSLEVPQSCSTIWGLLAVLGKMTLLVSVQFPMGKNLHHQWWVVFRAPVKDLGLNRLRRMNYLLAPRGDSSKGQDLYNERLRSAVPSIQPSICTNICKEALKKISVCVHITANGKEKKSLQVNLQLQ